VGFPGRRPMHFGIQAYLETSMPGEACESILYIHSVGPCGLHPNVQSHCPSRVKKCTRGSGWPPPKPRSPQRG
jgi:hypothetical protein